MAKFDNLEPKEAGKHRVTLTFDDGEQVLYDCDKVTVESGALVLQLATGVEIVIPMHAFMKADLDKT